MSQKRIDKCLILAFNISASDGEATSAFLRARKMILLGKGTYISIQKSSTSDNYIERVWKIQCNALQMMHMIENISIYSYRNDILVEMRMHGNPRNPIMRLSVKSKDTEKLDKLAKIIGATYETDF